VSRRAACLVYAERHRGRSLNEWAASTRIAAERCARVAISLTRNAKIAKANARSDTTAEFLGS
jgi:hypothetical protein